MRRGGHSDLEAMDPRLPSAVFVKSSSGARCRAFAAPQYVRCPGPSSLCSSTACSKNLPQLAEVLKFDSLSLRPRGRRLGYHALEVVATNRSPVRLNPTARWTLRVGPSPDVAKLGRPRLPHLPNSDCRRTTRQGNDDADDDGGARRTVTRLAAI